jgi:hypothetical protein
VGRAAGAPADFSGPMAKPHRMFVMTMAALLSIFDQQIGGAWLQEHVLGGPYENYGMGAGAFIELGLWIVLAGSIFTALNRARRALAAVNKK